MKAGRSCTLNYNTATFANPLWVRLGRVSSPKLPSGRPATRRTYRSHTNSKNVLGMVDAGITFTYVAKASGTDSVLTMLLNSNANDAMIDIAALEATPAYGVTGIRGPFKVSQIDRNEDDEDAVSFDVTLVECEDPFGFLAAAGSYSVSGTNYPAPP